MKPAALLLLALISLLPMTARANELSDAAQPPSADELKSRRDNAIRDIGAAAKDLDAARPEAALATLRHVREDLEDDGDPHLLRLTYDAMAIAGNELGDRAAELAGHFQGVLLHHLLRQDDALETALAELSLADAYQRYGLREPQYIALSNAQMSLSSARASKANSKDVEAAEGMYQSMIGQILWQNERIELALVHFRKARALARKGRIDPQNAGRIDQLIAEGERRMAGLQRTRATGVAQCTGGPHLQDIQERACRLEADHQIAEGSAAQAERILVSLLTDVSQGSLRPDRYEAARDLLLLRRAIHPPDHGDVIAISDLVANYLASKNQLAGASLIAARLADIAPLGDADRTRIAALCGHVARRAIRNGSEELARRFLEWQRKVVLIGLADPDRPLVDPLTDEADRLMTASLLRIESARIAELNGHDRLAAALRQKVEAQIATIPLRHFDAIERRLLYRYVKEDEYVFPTFAAAEEFMGRLGSRLPKSDERHDAAIQTWISFVGGWWSDVPRSIKMIEALIADIRSEPEGRTRALARSLEMLEQALDPSDVANITRYKREALQIYRTLPDGAASQIRLLLDLADEQDNVLLADALVEDAQKVRQDNGVSDLAPVVRLDLKRSLQKFRDGDRKEALDIGESILTRIKAAGQEKATLIDEPVRSLALMYAAEGRVADARALYATYIFPKSDPLRLGEEQVLSYQLALANIEAYYAPDQQTLSTLSSLLERARARVKSSPALEHDVRRAMAFAYHRLGDGAKARNAAQAALQGRAGIQTQAANAAADRKLIEAYVGGDWLASRALH